MNMLIDTLSSLSGEWSTWLGIVLLAVLGIVSISHWWLCPYVSGTAKISLEEAQQALSKKVFAGPRFLIGMVIGVGVSVTGLSLLYHNLEPAWGFFLVIAGVVIMQTEPIRLQIRETQNRVVAASAIGEDARLAAIDRLRASHQWLIGIHFLILIGVVAAIFIF
ncbi:MAG: hypothetical protein AAF501_17020 [Pseudomonadota bacterium]